MLSLITAATVASLPLPAVVGIAYNGTNLCFTLKIPFIFLSDFLGFATLAAVPFPKSINEPPPIEITQSQLFS